jgi:hypothetical protein
VDAWDKPDAIAAAIQAFNIPYVLQNRVFATPAGLSGWFGQLRTWYRSVTLPPQRGVAVRASLGDWRAFLLCTGWSVGGSSLMWPSLLS